jgi:hypothetical protein
MVEAVVWVEENKDWLVPMVVAIGGVTTAWNVATAAVNGFKAAAGIAAIAGVTGAVGAGTVGVLGIAGAGAAAGGYMQGQALVEAQKTYPKPDFSPGGGGLFPGAFGRNVPTNQNVTINVNQGNITAQEIYDKLRRLNKASGTAGGNFFQ